MSNAGSSRRGDLGELFCSEHNERVLTLRPSARLRQKIWIAPYPRFCSCDKMRKRLKRCQPGVAHRRMHALIDRVEPIAQFFQLSASRVGIGRLGVTSAYLQFRRALDA